MMSRHAPRRWLSAAAVAVLLATASGCADDDPTDSTPSADPPAATPGTTGSDPSAISPDGDGDGDGQDEAPSPAPPGAWEQAPIQLELVAEIPTAIALAARPGASDLYVASRDGRLWRLDRSSDEAGSESWTDPELVLDLRAEVTTDGERGLLSLAFSPDGSTLYLSRTDPSGHSIVEAATMGEGGPDPASRRVLLTVEQPFANHNGGHIAVDAHGLLYLGLGDGGGAGDPLRTGQDPTTLLGSMVRIDPTPQADAPYGIPADNPFADGASGAPEVWLYGVRNPWRFAFDRSTGDLWLSDVGQDRWEEVNLLRAEEDGLGRGANLGWNHMEGLEPFDGGTEPADHHRPLFVYARADGRCSITGGVIYRGTQVPELSGVYVYGDLCSGEVRGLQPSEDGVVDAGLPVSAEGGSLVSFGEDGDGELYVIELTGRVSRIVSAGR